MLSEHFYHEIIKNTTYGFGTLFNNIYIHKKNSNDELRSVIKVPIKYGPTQKFLARLNEAPDDLNNPVQITLPRMSFEITSLMYDSRRSSPATSSFLSFDSGNNLTKTYEPTPYQIGYNLYIMSKLSDDVWQIVEQILPYFKPSHTLTLKLLSEINETRDVSFSLNNIDINEDYEGDFSERTTFIYTLAFTADVMFFRPIITDPIQTDIVSSVSIGLIAGNLNGSSDVDNRLVVGPKATTNYSGVVTTSISSDLNMTSFYFDVVDNSDIERGDFIVIDNETMLVLDTSGSNTVKVRRGEYGTIITNHVSGSEVKVITTADDNLINYGDEFDFNGVIL